MKQQLEQRLARLEAHQPDRPDMKVLIAMDGQEQAAIAAYRAATPEPLQANQVVVIRKFCEVRT